MTDKYPSKRPGKFLTAEWRRLIMANYMIEPERLQPYLPKHTELDTWNGHHYISLVGFMFKKTKLLGLSIPFHSDFPEVNLRFYVRYREAGQWKRGVVFIREIVPKPALSFVANKLFRERYLTMPMKYKWEEQETQMLTRYEWRSGDWYHLEVLSAKQSQPIAAGSAEEFITEHYWGYTSIAADQTGEYQVAHPHWEVYPVDQYSIHCDFDQLYGNHFAGLNNREPESIFLAEGSPVSIYMKKQVFGESSNRNA
jgi:uncharacterized protein YqjF (DUF2071 family)